MVNRHGDDIINVSCVANTSEQCSYRWQATEVRTNNRVEILGQTISLIPQYFDMFEYIQCSAECRLRDKLCMVQVLHLEFKGNDTHHEEVKIRMSHIPLYQVHRVNCSCSIIQLEFIWSVVLNVFI